MSALKDLIDEVTQEVALAPLAGILHALADKVEALDKVEAESKPVWPVEAEGK